MKLLFSLILFFTCCRHFYAFHSESDTIPPIELSGIEITTERAILPMHRMPNVHGNILVAGKKNEVIELSKSNADLASVNQRQIFARIPGLMIWENDGSGIQIGVAARGLSPNRSWEFNTRQNGYDISPDVFGYPEAYYTPPMEAVERIEVIRGSASLQFGPQFGGMLNYVLKSGSGNTPFFYESRQSVGSFGLFSTFNAIGGTKNKWSYYAFAQQRRGNGWRQNSAFDIKSLYGSLEYRPSAKFLLGFNITHSQFLSQQPGGLTDEQFDLDWRSSSRSRNWLQVPWNVAALYSKVRFSNHSLLDMKVFGVLADRSSVGFMKAIDIADTINTVTNAYSNRKLDADAYETWGAELRWLFEYNFLGEVYQLAVGARYSDAYTHRKNDGMGSALALFDDSPVTDVFGKDLMYDNRNAAAYLENQFHVGNALTISPALRLENLTSIARGYTVAADGDFRPVEKRRSFLLAGVGVQYEWENTNLYSNVSQAYRPFTFGDLTPASTTDSIDANLKDASGFNAEFGYRGTYKNWLNFDVGLFYLLYDNRIGVVQQDGVNVKTNIGTSVSKGLEIYLEFDPLKFSSLNNRFGSLNVFVSGTWMDARYIRWENPTLANDPEKSIENKRVEYAPKYVWRGGVNYKLGKIHVGLQASYTDELYTDAPNTVLPSPNALVGKIDSYLLCDATVKLVFSPSLFVQSSLNNISDTHYATRRSGGYPGPGLLPGNGRSVTLTLGINL